jgi:hypothetical protein
MTVYLASNEVVAVSVASGGKGVLSLTKVVDDDDGAVLCVDNSVVASLKSGESALAGGIRHCRLSMTGNEAVQAPVFHAGAVIRLDAIGKGGRNHECGRSGGSRSRDGSDSDANHFVNRLLSKEKRLMLLVRFLVEVIDALN